MIRLQDEIVRIAKGEVGTLESGGNNKGEAIRKYLDATWFDEDSKEKGFPWCAAFVTWVLKEARSNMGLTWHDLNLYIGGAAYGWEDWAEQEGWEIFDDESIAEPGDLVTFGDFSHIGIVIADVGHSIITVEGNTNSKGTRDSNTGDGVWEKSRRTSLIGKLIRLPEITV